MPQTINQSEDNYSVNDTCTYKGVRRCREILPPVQRLQRLLKIHQIVFDIIQVAWDQIE